MEFIGFFLTVLVFAAIAAVYLLYLMKPGKVNSKSTATRVDAQFVRGKWVEVQGMMQQGSPANYRQAIMEGDKLVDLVLSSKVSGGTMGERLKRAAKLFTKPTYNDLWTAHKIRNKVAHEADFEGLSSDARLAVRGFEKALKELGII